MLSRRLRLAHGACRNDWSRTKKAVLGQCLIADLTIIPLTLNFLYVTISMFYLPRNNIKNLAEKLGSDFYLGRE
jgi:hypothetical protein